MRNIKLLDLLELQLRNIETDVEKSRRLVSLLQDIITVEGKIEGNFLDTREVKLTVNPENDEIIKIKEEPLDQ